MKACVVGGTGFVGMNLIRALVAGGHDVVGTRRVHANTLFARKLGAPLLRAELDDEDALIDAMRGRDVVFMCAGHYPRYSLQRDAEVDLARSRMQKTLRAAKRAGVQRYVLTSSVATVGPPAAGQRCSVETDRMALRAADCVYHSVKLAIEQEAHSACQQGLDVVTLCPSGIFGDLDVKAGTGFLIVALGNGALPFYVDSKINVVDADDLAQAHILAAERGRSGERYIIGSHNLRVSELLQLIARTLGLPLRSRRLPIPIAGWLATLSEARVRSAQNGRRPWMSRELVDMARFGQWVDSSKARSELGLSAPLELQATLTKACNWYLRHRYVLRNHATQLHQELGTERKSQHAEHSQLSDP